MNFNLKNLANHDDDEDTTPQTSRSDHNQGLFSKRWVKKALAGTFGVATLWSSFYVVPPHEMGNTTLLGHVMNTQPIGPGPHFKIPFIEGVDKLPVSLQTLHIPEFKVNTVDNQQITLKLNFNYTVPASDVNHLLYQVGGSGNKDIDNSMIPVVQDRAGRVFNQQNTKDVSFNRPKIQAELEKSVFDALKDQFGLQPVSLQIAEIIYSDSFIHSNDNAVTTKNDTVAEQNRVALKTAQAAQQVAQAKGEADSKIEQARGDAESVVLRACSQSDSLIG